MKFRDVYRLLENIDIGRRRFVKMFVELDDDEFYAYDRHGRLQIYRDLTPGFRPPPPTKFRVGNYVISEEIGSGLQGGRVYKAEALQRSRAVALKWPVQREELEALKCIQSKLANLSFLGLPELLDSGLHDGRPYAVTELLGADLSKVFLRLQRHSWKRRWHAVRIFGRLVLRRLEAVHDCGYVHCDVSPLNILVGRARGNYDFCGHLQFVPFLIDYGQARRHPGGGKLSGDKCSMEWSSIASADGGEPRPVHDLEAIGWTLVYGLVGDLPWFEDLSKYYTDYSPSMAPANARARVVEKVRDGKVQLLDRGWKSFGARWWNLAVVPEELLSFLDLCRTNRLPAGRPGYAVLHELLGGKPGMSERAAELEDLRNYQDDVLPLL
jgi:serine/threonine protein kinase